MIKLTKTITKYANRKFYCNTKSGYVTMPDIFEMVKNGDKLLIQDNRTKQDITEITLLKAFHSIKEKLVTENLHCSITQTIQDIKDL